MSFKRLSKYIIQTVALLAIGIFGGCADEFPEIPDYTRTGERVVLSVPVALPRMDKATRSPLDEAQLNNVESLWIRTYSAETGQATSKWVKPTPTFTGAETPQQVQIETMSGSSYIVAVANVDNLAVTKDNPGTTVALSELLEKADTWADFLNIAVVSPSSFEYVRAPMPPLPMAGCYSDLIVGGAHPEPTRIDEWQKKDFTPYFIPAQKADVTFTGAIHLRRLVSHINFNFIPGNDNIDLTVNSYQVMNVPKYSWLYERPEQNGMLTNFGDRATSQADALNYYVDVPQFSSQYVTKGADGSSSFDFWQAENKHTGTCSKFTDRDLKSTTSSSLFTSLTGNVWTPNNEASYIVVNCTVDYKNYVTVDNTGALDPNGENMYRNGEATYIIHLGYVGDSPVAERSKDFNCFRNVDYTYNVTVNGVNDIRVDAFAEDETYHGEEGLVVDLQYNTIDIDAHYAAFNIQLTEQELSAESFGFLITTYDNGEQISISEYNPQGGSGQSVVIYTDETKTKTIDPKYYNWIELRPTTDANTLAKYKPRYGGNADGKTCLLTELKGGWNSMPAASKSTSGYYTVFVNEYTYEPMYTGTNGYANEVWNGTGGRPNWMSYVNQNPRRFYIHISQSVSPDKNSIYARSKYGVSQQSLMTYYSDQVFAPADGTIPAGTAIAVERENENEGLNVRQSFAGGTSMGNGRWNTAQYLNGNADATTNLSINNANANNRPSWDNYIEATKPMEVPAVSQDRLQGGPPIPARTIASGNPHKIPALVIMTVGQAPSILDPQSNATYTYEAINGCMSRNRDNNGNGRIDPDELRWYVPSMNKYIGMSLGERALPQPLLNFTGIELPFVNNKSFSTTTGSITNYFYTRYMFVASNNGSGTNRNVLWAIEGTSMSTYANISNWTGITANPWQIRCIRNLGADMTSVSNDDKVSIPYVVNGNTIRMSYLNVSSIRTVQYSGNGTTAGRMPVHTLNSYYNRMYYGFEYATADITVPEANRPTTANFYGTYSRLIDYINSNPCANAGLTGTGWRVPNQLELTLMLNQGNILSTNNENYLWLSSTVNYFSHQTGKGSDDVTNKFFLCSTRAQTTQLNAQNYSNAGQTLYIRCVRDRN